MDGHRLCAGAPVSARRLVAAPCEPVQPSGEEVARHTLRRLADALEAQQVVCHALGTADMEVAGLMFARYAQLAREGVEP